MPSTVTVGTGDVADNTGDLIVTFVDLSGTQGITDDGSRPLLPLFPWGTYEVAPSNVALPGCVVTINPPTSAFWESCSLIWQPPPHAAVIWTSGGSFDGAGGIIANPKWPPQALPASGELDAAAGISGRIVVRQTAAGLAAGTGGVSGRTAGVSRWFVSGELDGTAGISGRITPPTQTWQVAGKIDGAAGILGDAAIRHRFFLSSKVSATASTTGAGPVPSLRVTNFVRNPRPEMNQGAGNLPAEWFCFDNSGETPTQSVIGTGTTAEGIPYIDFQFAGTGIGGSGFILFQTDGSISASQGTTWSYSQFLKLQAGSLANINSIQLVMFTANNSVGFGIAPHLGPAITPTTAGLATQWFHFDGELLNDSGMDGFACGLYIVPGSGAFDMTLRTGGAKAEQTAASTGSQYLVVPQVGFVPGLSGSTTFVY